MACLDMVVGPMFAGKTTELIRRQQRLKTIGKTVLVVNHAANTREGNSATELFTHDRMQAQGSPVIALDAIRDLFQHPLYPGADAIIIDEAQFYWGLKNAVLRMVETDGKHVIVAGLLSRADRSPFGQMHLLILHADTVTTLHALCRRCGDGSPAIYTHKLRETPTQIGGAELYECLCRRHYLILTRRQSSLSHGEEDECLL